MRTLGGPRGAWLREGFGTRQPASEAGHAKTHPWAEQERAQRREASRRSSCGGAPRRQVARARDGGWLRAAPRGKRRPTPAAARPRSNLAATTATRRPGDRLPAGRLRPQHEPEPCPLQPTTVAPWAAP